MDEQKEDVENETDDVGDEDMVNDHCSHYHQQQQQTGLEDSGSGK